MTDLNIIVLAAGNSSRMGRPKQTLLFEGKSLLQRTLDAAREANARNLVVVTGANYKLFEKELHQQEVTTVYNQDWASGMASSINIGLTALLDKEPSVKAVVFAVCDQPFISAAIFQGLIKRQQQTGKDIIAAEYEKTVGTPVLFRYNLFPAIRTLRGQEGARKLLSVYPEDVASITFEQGHIDVDTPADYDHLTQG